MRRSFTDQEWAAEAQRLGLPELQFPEREDPSDGDWCGVYTLSTLPGRIVDYQARPGRGQRYFAVAMVCFAVAVLVLAGWGWFRQ